jgi:hypothetical protein
MMTPLTPRLIRFALFLWLVTGVLIRPGMAQTIRGTITGTITDSTGAVMPGATVTVTNTATAISNMVVRDARRNYTIPLLSPGTYQVTVEPDGFKKSGDLRHGCDGRQFDSEIVFDRE